MMEKASYCFHYSRIIRKARANIRSICYDFALTTTTLDFLPFFCSEVLEKKWRSAWQIIFVTLNEVADEQKHKWLKLFDDDKEAPAKEYFFFANRLLPSCLFDGPREDIFLDMDNS